MSYIPKDFAPLKLKSVFLNHIGPFYGVARDGGVVVGILMDDRHMNWSDVAHGGVMTAMADAALSYQVAFSQDPPLPLATINLHTNFIGSAKLGDWLEATACIDKISQNMAFVSGYISTNGNRILTMAGVYRVFHPKG